MQRRVALITGGTGGIGTAICRALAQQGVTVVAGFNGGGSSVKAESWLKEQQQEGFKFNIAYGDVSNFESCSEMITAISKDIGPIDIVVNNAGITRDCTLKKMTREQWDLVLRINLNSVFNVTKNVLDSMLERQFGRIISISSINGQKGQYGQTNYSTSKAGMYGFTKALAQEVAAKGITVNTISPGYVATPMVKLIAPDILEKIRVQIPVGRLAAPEEIARVVAFLAHEDSGFITGANFAVNGGQHMY